MKTVSTSLLLPTSSAWFALATAFLLACAPLQPASTPQDVLKNEVAAFLEQYLVAISSRDAEQIRRMYVTDDRFVWIEDGKVRYRKVDEVLASLAALPSGSVIRTELRDLAVVPVGQSSAHAWAAFTTTVGEPPRGFSFGGAISLTLERDGTSWRVVGGHTSSPSRR